MHSWWSYSYGYFFLFFRHNGHLSPSRNHYRQCCTSFVHLHRHFRFSLHLRNHLQDVPADLLSFCRGTRSKMEDGDINALPSVSWTSVYNTKAFLCGFFSLSLEVVVLWVRLFSELLVICICHHKAMVHYDCVAGPPWVHLTTAWRILSPGLTRNSGFTQ